MKKHIVALLLLVFCLNSNAQAWKTVRHEVNMGVGASNFLGDLGGAKGIGTHGIKDLKFQMTRPTFMYKYMLNQYLSVKGSLIWSLLKGDDAITKNDIRNNRNLSFRSNIGEVTGYIDYFPYADKVYPRYKLKGVRGNKAFSLSPYLFAGIGATFFNPKTIYNGDWVALQPLATEGQGLAGRPEKYKRVTMSFPVGAGVKYRIDKQLALSFELSLRYTTSDYIDDVSTSYYLPNEIAASTGDVAAALSDRSINPDINGVLEYPDGRNNYLQRGDPRWNDAYMFGIFSIHYRLIKGLTFIPKF
jgi:opacity protein-like surface antigen